MKNYKPGLLIIIVFALQIAVKAQTPIKDKDGNVYKTILVGNQTWFAENLKTTHYNDGTSIPLVKDSVQWGNLTTAAYCWFRNDQAKYGSTYGALYTWYAVETGKLCPAGWHVPAEADWSALLNSLGGAKNAAAKLKEKGTTRWIETTPETTNATGFTAIPGGVRTSYGMFNYIGSHAAFWSAMENSSANAWLHSMICTMNEVFKVDYEKSTGIAVRCVKN